MRVKWDYCSQYMESHKSHVPNHQPVDDDWENPWLLPGQPRPSSRGSLYTPPRAPATCNELGRVKSFFFYGKTMEHWKIHRKTMNTWKIHRTSMENWKIYGKSFWEMGKVSTGNLWRIGRSMENLWEYVTLFLISHARHGILLLVNKVAFTNFLGKQAVTATWKNKSV